MSSVGCWFDSDRRHQLSKLEEGHIPSFNLYAAMAELADALDLGSSGATRTGSIPASRTNLTTENGSFLFILGFIH